MRIGHLVLLLIILTFQISIIQKINQIQIPTALPIPTAVTNQPIYTITAYTNRIQECNQDNSHTATLEKPVAGWTCAVSRDLIHWLGGRIYIKGIGVRRVNDLMNVRFEKSVDIFYGSLKSAKKFGKQEQIVIYLGR